MREERIVEHSKSLLEAVQGTKIEIERDLIVKQFVQSLFHENAWEAVEGVILPAVQESKPIYAPLFLPPAASRITLLQELVDNNSKYFDKVVAGVAAQFGELTNPDGVCAYLSELFSGHILESSYERFARCPQCGSVSLENSNRALGVRCERCRSDLWIVYVSHLPPRLKESLINNQFLELYVKESFVKAEYQLIGKEINGSSAYTSIRWRVFPRPVEIDVSAVNGGSLILCECKTSKITLNTVDEKIGQVFHILSSFERTYNEKPDIDLFFITTDTIERDVPITDYSTMPNIRCHFYEREQIPSLSELVRAAKPTFA